MSARPFDPHWTTDNPSILAYLEFICSFLSASKKGQRQRRNDAQLRFNEAVKSIVLDLFRAHKSDPKLEVGIASGWTVLQRLSKSRYGASYISARTFSDAMEALLDTGRIAITTPHWDDPMKRSSRVARYRLTPSFMGELETVGVSVVDLRKRESAEGIRLKDCKKRLVEFEDDAFTNDARDRLQSVNAMLESHWADLALDDERLAAELQHFAGSRDDEAAQSFDFAARTVYRVFNNNDWAQGGRFYGAWWMSCPSRLRPLILIDGKRTVEVDYSGLHAAMLYAENGMQIPDDPYQRCVVKSHNKAERQLIKRTFNALLNAKSARQLNEIEGYSAAITGRCWSGFKQFVIDSYPEFNKYFGSGIGLNLQRRDSDLAEIVMLEFAAMGYACLPVHDSFIVHHALQGDLQRVMAEAFRAEFDVSGKVGAEMGLGEVVEGSEIALEADLDDLLSPVGFEARLETFRMGKICG